MRQRTGRTAGQTTTVAILTGLQTNLTMFCGVHGVNAALSFSNPSRSQHLPVSDRHGVHLVNHHGRHMRGILLEIEAHEGVSQRHLSQHLGMALGLTNLLVRRIVAKGWIKVVHIRPNRVRYLLTPAGLAAKARLTRESLASSVTFYAEARERIRER